MSKKQSKSYFWITYSDLMTTLFFIMLVLFVLTISILQKRNEATQKQLDKITEIEEATKKIDPRYFVYNETYKKHILNINVSFNTGSANINDIDVNTRIDLLNAGKSISSFIIEANKKYNAKYLLIIEGQTSKDNYLYNDELSYERALSLFKFWTNKNNIMFDKDICEVIISGSGYSGLLRDSINRNNQRFLIHILPKPGLIKNDSIKN